MTKIRLKPGLKERWLKALTSGEYSKARGLLHNPRSGGHCCLGVLSEVAEIKRDEITDVPLIPSRDFKRIVAPDQGTHDFDQAQDVLSELNDKTAGWDKAISYIKQRFV